MASFIKKIVARTRSPGKQHKNNFDHFSNRSNTDHYCTPYAYYAMNGSESFSDERLNNHEIAPDSIHQASNQPLTLVSHPQQNVSGSRHSSANILNDNRSSPTNEDNFMNNRPNLMGSPRSSKSQKSDRSRDQRMANENHPVLDVPDEKMLASKISSDAFEHGSIGSEHHIHHNTVRHRSHSPVKSNQPIESCHKSRSKSPRKKINQTSHVVDYLSPQCHNQGCSVALIIQDTKFLVCKHQLSQVSEYFRLLFLGNKCVQLNGAYQHSLEEFSIVVSSFKYPPPSTQFKWFLDCTVYAPFVKSITDDILETCMRLSKRFRVNALEIACAKYVRENVDQRPPMVALCWLNWILKHRFDKATHDACLPCVATASLACLEEHRNMITEKLLADLLAAKLRTVYNQAVNVFQTIHTMNHFYTELERCPRCGRQKHEKVRVKALPCRKLIGCDRCLKNCDCDTIGHNYQAFYKCHHGLNPLGDENNDCKCLIPILASNIAKCGVPHIRLPSEALNRT